MTDEHCLRPIAHIRSDYNSKFGIPRQSGVVDCITSDIVFEPEFREPEALRGIEGYSHLWLIWQFSENLGSWSPTVRPPRLGGNTRMGVFATRSPYRPNPLGLSCVRLDSISLHGPEGPVLRVLGADLMDGTPIYDIKPYAPYTDAHPEAKDGFAAPSWERRVEVLFPPELAALLPAEKLPALIKSLEQDPRPAYQDAPGRVYGMVFAGHDIRFVVSDGLLRVVEVLP